MSLFSKKWSVPLIVIKQTVNLDFYEDFNRHLGHIYNVI